MITPLYIISALALGASWAFAVLCSLSYLFKVSISKYKTIFYAVSITVLTLVLMCIFYDRDVPLRTVIIISYIFLLVYYASKDISKTLLVYVVFILEMATAEFFNILVIIITGHYSLEQCFFANVIGIIITNILAVLINRRFSKKTFSPNPKYEQLALLVMMLITVFVAAVIQTTFENAIIGKFDLSAATVPIFIAVVFVIYIAGAIAALGFIKGVREERENRVILEQQHLLEDMYDTTRMFRHNYKNTMMMLKGYCDNGDYGELSEKINDLTDEINDFDLVGRKINILKIEDSALRNLIMLKMITAEKAGVMFNMKISGTRFKEFEKIDMMNVIGILIDNAIEAAQESDEKEMEMEMRAYEKRESITVINSFKTKPDINHIFDKNYSTKNKEGLGLYYANKTLRKKKDVDFVAKCRDDYFIVSIEVSK